MYEDPDFVRCAFCRRISVGHFIFEDDMVVVFRDAHPLTRGHLHIAPKRHSADFFQIPPRSYDSLERGLQAGWEWLEENLAPDGYNIGINIGEAAGQSVPHGNIHLIPRYQGEILDRRRGSRWLLGEPEKTPTWNDKKHLGGTPLLQGSRTTALSHPYPLSPGHAIVMPGRQEGNFFCLEEREREEMWGAVRTLRERLQQENSPDGYNIAIDVGEMAGQESSRSLLHLVPRWHGDAARPFGARWMAGENPDYIGRGIGH